MVSVFRDLGRGLTRAWENVVEGWRQLGSRSSNALTRFFPWQSDAAHGALEPPRWGTLAGDVGETARSVVVEVEIPGVERQDREYVGDPYYVMERAFGSFQSAIPLPRSIDGHAANASYRSGVLTVEIPKSASAGARRLVVK